MGYLGGKPTTSWWGLTEYPPGLICPSAPGRTPEQVGFWRSMGFNHTGLSWRDVHGNRFLGVRSEQVARPSEKLQMIDASDFHAVRNNADYINFWFLRGDTYGADYWAMTTYRHMENANVTFFDGHVESLFRDEVWLPDEPSRIELWDVLK
ncbi:MAG: prepilin-type processing-associated H-X9-DG protein [Rhodothermales bacterium]|jgi:prepilin-type processing-associated H-X9-DG protein